MHCTYFTTQMEATYLLEYAFQWGEQHMPQGLYYDGIGLKMLY